MRCKNCGANYRTIELKCPYCGTPNRLGAIWAVERTDAEIEYEKKNQEIKKITNPYVWNRILNRILVILCGFTVLFFVSVFGFFFIKDFVLNHRNVNSDIEVLEQYYQDGDFASMNSYLRKYELNGRNEFYVYTQATLLFNDYQEFTNKRLSFLNESDDEKMEDDYYLEYSIKYGNDILRMKEGNYSQLDSKNEELYDSYCEEINAYFTYVLGMDEKDYELLNQDYINSSDMDQLITNIKERKTWNEL